MVLGGLSASLVIIMLRPMTDALLVVGGVSGTLAPTTLALLAFMKSQEVHLSVNSRLDAFMLEHGRSEHAAGVEEGKSGQGAKK